jgi:LAO/AO transport system kinase
MSFIKEGHKVAVLAIDPSSEITKGSILGDKTRMEELSREENSFIRPSSSRGFLGGVHPATRDTIRLCESAGYDVIIVETVGVGQSETAVSDVVDYLLLLAAPGAGDELQGIKRGLLEKIDAVVVNKADTSNKIAAQVAEKQFQSALNILRDKKIPTHLVSSIEKTGLNDVFLLLKDCWSKDKPELTRKRRLQDQAWLEKYIQQIAFLSVREQLVTSKEYSLVQKDVFEGKIDVRTAAKKVLKTLTFV